MANKQTYKYIKSKSIIFDQKDEYSLTEKEYYLLYSFYVTYSMCGNQSQKKKNFETYGWSCNNIQYNNKQSTPLGNALKSVIDFSISKDFIFTEQDNLEESFIQNRLTDGVLNDFDTERAVIAITNEQNKYLKLFYRIRNGFAHGNFLLKFSSINEKMVIIQDHGRGNVTARIVIKLSTLLKFISIIDCNKSLNINTNKSNDRVA